MVGINFLTGIVQPIRISHGIRFDKKYDSEAQCYKQISVTNTFTYIPLLETLKVLLNNESIQNTLLMEMFTKLILFFKIIVMQFNFNYSLMNLKSVIL